MLINVGAIGSFGNINKGNIYPPLGYVFLTDSDNYYLIDEDGYYLIEEI